MKTRRNKKGGRKYRRSLKSGGRRTYKGGQGRPPAGTYMDVEQPRWPAPPNPHTTPVGCRFLNFRPLILSQFGGTRRRTRRGGSKRRR